MLAAAALYAESLFNTAWRCSSQYSSLTWLLVDSDVQATRRVPAITPGISFFVLTPARLLVLAIAGNDYPTRIVTDQPAIGLGCLPSRQIMLASNRATWLKPVADLNWTEDFRSVVIFKLMPHCLSGEITVPIHATVAALVASRTDGPAGEVMSQHMDSVACESTNLHAYASYDFNCSSRITQ